MFTRTSNPSCKQKSLPPGGPLVKPQSPTPCPPSVLTSSEPAVPSSMEPEENQRAEPAIRSVGPLEPGCLTADVAREKAEAKDRRGPAALGVLRPLYDPRVPSPPPSIPSSPPPTALLGPSGPPSPHTLLHCPGSAAAQEAEAPTRERKSRLPRPIRDRLAPLSAPRPLGGERRFRGH